MAGITQTNDYIDNNTSFLLVACQLLAIILKHNKKSELKCKT